jgi:hypothetical protein
MGSDWGALLALGSVVISILALLSRTLDKSLSIREYESYRSGVDRDIQRIERRLQLIEQTRPTTGELEILAESLNKRIDALPARQTRQ